MKKYICVLFMFLGFLSGAQDRTNVQTFPKATLYPLSDDQLPLSGKRYVFALSDKGFKRLRKTQNLSVYGYANCRKAFLFDTYIVNYKDKRWLLRKEDVIENSLIEFQNTRIGEEYENLKLQELCARNNADSVLNYIGNRLSLYIEQAKDSLNYYRNLKERLPYIEDSLENVVESRIQNELNANFDAWASKQTKSVRNAASVLRINKSELSGPNSAGGCDYKLYFRNVSKKTIKYLDWYGTAYNAVDDPCSCEIRRTSFCSGQCVGPIFAGDDRWASWGCVIYNYSAETIKLDHIRIEYLDGTSVSLSSSSINALISAPSTEITGKHWTLINEASDSIISEDQCKGEIGYWEKVVYVAPKCRDIIMDGKGLSKLKYYIEDYVKIFVNESLYHYKEVNEKNDRRLKSLFMDMWYKRVDSQYLYETASAKRMAFERENFIK